MAKPDKPLLSLGARGTIAHSLTFQKRGQLTIARKKPIPADPRSPAQLAQRQIYRDAVDAWHALSPEEKEDWHGVCPGLTAYQCFMSSQLKYVPAPIPIDIGAEPIDRSSSRPGYGTLINKENPANASGIITSVEIWAYSNLSVCKVGIFYTTNGNTLKCRSAATIGNVTAGSKQTFNGLSLSVQTGDYIGMYFSNGTIEHDISGYAGLWDALGDKCLVDDESDYAFYTGDAVSLYGTGEGPP
ncbi:hypothetical protein ES705_24851 [subsurface metagenome]